MLKFYFSVSGGIDSVERVQQMGFGYPATNKKAPLTLPEG